MSKPKTAFYFYRLKDDDFVKEFCVANHADPTQYVETLARDGTLQRWDKREEGDLLVFRPPDSYAGDQPLMWMCNRDLQVVEPLSEERRQLLETEALCRRVSVDLGTN